MLCTACSAPAAPAAPEPQAKLYFYTRQASLNPWSESSKLRERPEKERELHRKIGLQVIKAMSE